MEKSEQGLEIPPLPEHVVNVLQRINEHAEANIQIIQANSPEGDIAWLEFIAFPLPQHFPYTFILQESLHTEVPKREINVVIASREEGLKQIHSTIGTAINEDTWIFIPSLSLWVHDVSSQDDENVGGDPYLRGFFSELVPEVELVHTHPDKTMEKLFNDGRRTASYLVEAATPTTGDFISHTQQQGGSNRDCRWLGSIVSHYGVTTYEMSPENLKYGGGAAGSYFDKDVDPQKDPLEEIERIVKKQEKECTYISHLRPEMIPAFKINFDPMQVS